MSYQSSELHCKRGTILLQMGHYEDALAAFRTALDIRIHHSYYYNKAVALQRLGRLPDAKQALRQAADCCAFAKSKERRKRVNDYKRALDRIEAGKTPLMWWEWWFAQGGTGRKIFGGILVGLLIPLVAAFIAVSLWALLSRWFGWTQRPEWNTLGSWWAWYVVPLAAILLTLLSPIIRTVGAEGIELQPVFPKEHILEPMTEHLGPLLAEVEKATR